jgi:molecular chaperone GrpE
MEEKNVIEETVSEEVAEAVAEEAESKEMKELKEKLEKAEAERVATNDKYLRMMAEYDNYRKRSTKEKESAYAEAYCDAIGAILPVIDNLERALAYSEGETLTEGVKMTLKQFEDTMERLGMKAYGERGDEFDPKIHNAIMQTEDPELGENRIAAVLQKGYCKGEKIIRHAMVTVTG